MATEHLAHFLFWKTGQPIDPVKQLVHGQFGGLSVELNSIEHIGNPAVEIGKPVDPDYDKYLHLAAYLLASFPPFQATVVVSNQFGDETCQLGSPTFLLVPAFKGHQPNLPEVAPRGPFFLCYEVLQGRKMHPKVKLEDQFGQLETTYLTLAYLGVPVNFSGKGNVHLALYEMSPGVQLNPYQTVYIRDPLHKETPLTATYGSYFGVPSKKTVV